MVTALLLANAGVDASDVVADYEESVRAMAGSAAHGGPTHDRQAFWSPHQVAVWLTDVTPHVRSFVEESEAILDGIGVAGETKRSLRLLLTE